MKRPDNPYCRELSDDEAAEIASRFHDGDRMTFGILRNRSKVAKLLKKRKSIMVTTSRNQLYDPHYFVDAIDRTDYRLANNYRAFQAAVYVLESLWRF